MKGKKWRKRRVRVDQGGKYVSGKVRRAWMRKVKETEDGWIDERERERSTMEKKIKREKKLTKDKDGKSK